MPTMTKRLSVGDIIEIVSHDENGMLHLRRVKVSRLSRGPYGYAIIGTNMKGKNSVSYSLSLEPLTEPERLADKDGWFYFDASDDTVD